MLRGRGNKFCQGLKLRHKRRSATSLILLKETRQKLDCNLSSRQPIRLRLQQHHNLFFHYARRDIIATTAIMAGKMTLYKLVVLGDGGVGKTALTIQVRTAVLLKKKKPLLRNLSLDILFLLAPLQQEKISQNTDSMSDGIALFKSLC